MKLILDYALRGSKISQIKWQQLIGAIADGLTKDSAKLLLDNYPEFSAATWRTIMTASSRTHNLEVVKLLLEDYATYVDSSTFGVVLHETASSGDEVLMKILLGFHHTDIDGKKRIFRKAFDSAAATNRAVGSDPNATEPAQGFDPDATEPALGSDSDAFEEDATKLDRVLQMLLTDGRIGNYSGISHALYTAGVDGRLERVRTLLTYASTTGIELKDDLYLALESAAENGRSEMVELLLRQCQQTGSIPEYCYRAALHNAARNFHDHVVQLLLDQGPANLSSRYSIYFQGTAEGDVMAHETKSSPSEDFWFDEEDFEMGDADAENSDAEEPHADRSEENV
jgi:hypothetical protein